MTEGGFPYLSRQRVSQSDNHTRETEKQVLHCRATHANGNSLAPGRLGAVRYTGDRAPLVAEKVKTLPALQEPWIDPWVRKIPWRRKWQPTPAFLPGESHGQRSLAGYGPLGPKELDMTE